MRAIITGATSMLGIALTNTLINNGHEVIAVLRAGSVRENLLPDSPAVTKVYAELSEYTQLEPIEADVMYHFAWAGTKREERNDIKTQTANVVYTADALAWAARCKCKTFIGAGSQAEYGVWHSLIAESTPTFPETAYGIAKNAAGQYVRYKSKELGVKHIWARIFSVYGPHDNCDTMIMSAIRKAKAGEQLRFTSGTQTWNYLYEDDAANLFMLLGTTDVPEGVYNVASPESAPLRTYINRTVCTLMEEGVSNVKPFFDTSAPAGVELNVRTTKIYGATKYHPAVSFADGIRRVVLSQK